MTEKYTPQPFEALCQRYEAWVIKYCATGFDSPLYLIWYTDSDENNTDRILAYESGKMFAEKSLAKLKAGVWASIDNLVVPENVMNWLGNFEDLEVVESCTYDLLSIEHAIAQNNLDIATIEGFADFINLFNDYVEQDQRNSSLQAFSDREIILDLWDYFYKFIFWPRFNDKEKFESWDRPPLVVDVQELLIEFKHMKQAFEDNIQESAEAIR